MYSRIAILPCVRIINDDDDDILFRCTFSSAATDRAVALSISVEEKQLEWPVSARLLRLRQSSLLRRAEQKTGAAARVPGQCVITSRSCSGVLCRPGGFNCVKPSRWVRWRRISSLPAYVGGLVTSPLPSDALGGLRLPFDYRDVLRCRSSSPLSATDELRLVVVLSQ